MLITFILNIAVYIFTAFGILIEPIVSTFGFPVVSIGNTAGYVFGNIMLLNGFLPVTDLMVILAAAISFKTAIFGYKAFITVTHLLNHFRRTFLQISV